MSSFSLSIAIPTMNRWSFLKDSIPCYLSRPEVAEVVICDENGDDIEQILKSSFGKNPKLKLFKNERRLGIYENKLKAMTLTTCDWIALFDSDNIFDDVWFDTISSTTLLTQTVYASADFKTIDSREKTRGSVNTPCKKFSGLTIDAKTWNSIFERPGWNFLLNDGNWLVPRETIKTLPTDVKSDSLMAADAIFMLRRFIKGGYSIHYLPGLEYIHLVHDDSSWIKTSAESERILTRTNWLI